MFSLLHSEKRSARFWQESLWSVFAESELDVPLLLSGIDLHKMLCDKRRKTSLLGPILRNRDFPPQTLESCPVTDFFFKELLRVALKNMSQSCPSPPPQLCASLIWHLLQKRWLAWQLLSVVCLGSSESVFLNT